METNGVKDTNELSQLKARLGELQETVALMGKRLDTLEKSSPSADSEPTPPETPPRDAQWNAQSYSSNPFDSSLDNDDLWRVVFAQAGQVALRTAFELRVFEAFENRSGPVTADEIAKFTGAERPLISRIMRAMNVTGVFKEHGHEKYVHNNLSLKLMDPTIRAMATGFSGNTGALLPMMPDYIAHMNGRNPGDLSPNFVHFATKGANNSFFDYIQPRPALLSRFSKSMRADTLVNQAHVQSLVSSLFPENDQTQTNGSPDADNHVTMIDVGGGRGNVLNSLRKARPELRGRFMVQDLPQEVEGRESADGVEAMAHDFFTPQPIIGASVYFFRHIFHDWSDAQSQRILTNLIPAMSAESRIVIADAVLLDEGAGSFQVLRDIVMMALGGCERTESQWRTLLEGVGLRITRIVTSSGEARNRDGLIEAVKA